MQHYMHARKNRHAIMGKRKKEGVLPLRRLGAFLGHTTPKSSTPKARDAWELLGKGLKMKERVGGRRVVRGEWRRGERLGIERLLENRKSGRRKGIGQATRRCAQDRRHKPMRQWR